MRPSLNGPTTSAFRVYVEIYDWTLYSWSIAIYGDASTSDEREFFAAFGRDLSDSEVAKKYTELIDKRDEEKGERIGNEFLQLLKKHVPKTVGRMKKVSAEATDFVLQNPFALYYFSAISVLETADDSPTNAADYYRSAFFLFIAAFEGLLNLIYELYARTDLRDERIYERLSKENLDIKVRLAPLYCECFSDKLVDHKSDVFRRFHSIVNLRNDFIHANFTQPMKRPIVTEDGHMFIVEQSDRDQSGLPKSIDALNAADVATIKQSIDQMTETLLEGMKPRFRREFRRILYQENIQITVEDGEIIVTETDE